jgi:hypothetical protein
VYETVDTYGCWRVSLLLFKKEVWNSQFPLLLIFFVSKVYGLKLIYAVDTLKVKNKAKWFWKSHFRPWDMSSEITAFLSLLKCIKRDSLNFRYWKLMKNPSSIFIFLDIGRKTYSLLATRTFLVLFLILLILLILILILLHPNFVRAVT